MIPSTPGRVLRLAIVGWGLGYLAIGRRDAGLAWLAAEALALVAVTATTLLFADTTWYLLPFLLGTAFIAAWTTQAVLAYRAAQRMQGAIPPAERRSPAAAIAWLTLPLLAWGTGFWLVGGGAATPAAVVDRFMAVWEVAGSDGGWQSPAPVPADDPAALERAAAAALERLQELCAAGVPADGCDEAADGLLSDVRVRISLAADGRQATAVAELVRYERRPSTVLGMTATQLVPVPIQRILALELAARPVAGGAERWTIVNAEAE